MRSQDPEELLKMFFENQQEKLRLCNTVSSQTQWHTKELWGPTAEEGTPDSPFVNSAAVSDALNSDSPSVKWGNNSSPLQHTGGGWETLQRSRHRPWNKWQVQHLLHGKMNAFQSGVYFPHSYYHFLSSNKSLHLSPPNARPSLRPGASAVIFLPCKSVPVESWITRLCPCFWVLRQWQQFCGDVYICKYSGAIQKKTNCFCCRTQEHWWLLQLLRQNSYASINSKILFLFYP